MGLGNQAMRFDLLSLALGIFLGAAITVIYAILVEGSRDDERHGRG